VISQERGFERVLAVFVSLVVYRNLLFCADFVQAGGQDKTAKVRQRAERLLLSLLKAPRVGVERQSGVTMSREFLHQLCGVWLLARNKV